MGKEVLLLIILGMEVLNHAVLVLDVLLDAVQVLGDLAEGLLLEPVDRVLLLLRRRQDVLDGVGHDEVLVRLQPQHRLLVHARHPRLLVAAVVGEVAD